MSNHQTHITAIEHWAKADNGQRGDELRAAANFIQNQEMELVGLRGAVNSGLSARAAMVQDLQNEVATNALFIGLMAAALEQCSSALRRAEPFIEAMAKHAAVQCGASTEGVKYNAKMTAEDVCETVQIALRAAAAVRT